MESSNPRENDPLPERENQDPSLIIEYTNLLHRYRDPNAPDVKQFVERHQNDRVFLNRANVLNKMFRMKQEFTV